MVLGHKPHPATLDAVMVRVRMMWAIWMAQLLAAMSKGGAGAPAAADAMEG